MTEPNDKNNHKSDGREAVPTADYGAVALGPGAQVGPYKLLSILGEGGYGIVYLAEQRRPVKRQVALKVIKPGMDSRQVLARFEAEEQALALMEHPHVACVYDAGLTPSGQPYFVMEHVKGLPITEHCDKHKLMIEQRLQLFLRVCEAVQHAHQKGIIHRDLKPSNILVSIQGQDMIPKVIDFGVARAISQPLTERTLHTEQGQLIGTPEYMSPEQANLTNQAIDTRTDIYSLGVVLYELLTGVLPFDPKTLRSGGVDHIRKVICEEDPKIPSTRLSRGSLVESTESAKRRQTDIRTLHRKIYGDLDWITLKAMEKDRTRRYATVDALATDIRNHTNHQPVVAAPPGAVYRVRKFARRHRQAMAAAGAAVALFSVLLWAARAHIEAGREHALVEKLEHERILDKARDLFEARGMQGQGVADPSSEALAMLEPLVDSRHVGPKARLLRANILAEYRYYGEAVPILERLTEEPPEIAGAAYALLARILWEVPSLGPEELRKVDEYRRRAEELLPETGEAYYLRAMMALGIPEKLRLLDAALSLDGRHYPSRRLRALTYRASRKYGRLNEDALLMTHSRPNDPLGYSLRATALREVGDCERAVECYDSAIERTPKSDRQYVELNSQRCEVLIQERRYERAIADARACLRIAPDATILRFHIFCALTALGEYEQASAIFRRIDDFGLGGLGGPRHWSMKHVFDALEASRPWHPPDRKPEGPAFLAMLAAEETHHNLSAKARRLTTDGFTAQWSPDGTRVAFSIGVQGYSGVAVYDPTTGETELLIVPGKDPKWSPDGKSIAFVRDRQVLRVREFIAAERINQNRPLEGEEVWIMDSDGTTPRRLARGSWPSWSADSTRVYYYSHGEEALCSISIAGRDLEPTRIMACSDPYAFQTVSPDGGRVAYWEGAFLKVKDLASQTVITEWPVPVGMWSVSVWSPTGNELSMGGPGSAYNWAGLWIYPVDGGEPVRVLSGQITYSSWAPDRTKLVLDLGPPYYEIWVADLDPGLSTAQALGPARTVEQHCLERIEDCNRELAEDPNLFDNHRERTQCALWIGSDQASRYLQELGRAVDRVSVYPRICAHHARWILDNSALHDRLLPLALVLARKATQKAPGYGRDLAARLQRMGQQEEAVRLRQMTETAGNFLVNGGFEDGVRSPCLRYGNVTTEVVTQLLDATVPEGPAEGKFCLYVEVAPGAAHVWDAGLRPLGAAFEAGKQYTISAFLKAKQGALDVKFTPQLDQDPWTGYGDEVITITDTWAEYHVTTPVFTEDVSPASFTFHIGAATGGFWLDDMRFYEGDYVPTGVAERSDPADPSK